MKVYAVFGTDDANQLSVGVKAAFPKAEDRLELHGGSWLVASQHQTTKEVAEKIGSPMAQKGLISSLVKDLDSSTQVQFVVVPVTTYWGIHSPNTWEWIQSRSDELFR